MNQCALSLLFGRVNVNSLPNTFRTDYINILTVSLNGFLYDGKTKSGSFFIFATEESVL